MMRSKIQIFIVELKMVISKNKLRLTIIPFIRNIKKTRLMKIILTFLFLWYPKKDSIKRPSDRTVILALTNKSSGCIVNISSLL